MHWTLVLSLCLVVHSAGAQDVASKEPSTDTDTPTEPLAPSAAPVAVLVQPLPEGDGWKVEDAPASCRMFGALSAGLALPIGDRRGKLREGDEFSPALNLSILAGGGSRRAGLGARLDFGLGGIWHDEWEAQTGAELGLSYLLNIAAVGRLSLLDAPLKIALTAELGFTRMATGLGRSRCSSSPCPEDNARVQVGYHALSIAPGLQLSYHGWLVELRYAREFWCLFLDETDHVHSRDWNLMWNDRVFVSVGGLFEGSFQRRTR